MKEFLIGAVKVNGDTTISYVANPKRSGSKAHARYEEYQAAATIQEALDLGATKADLKYDAEHQFLEFSE